MRLTAFIFALMCLSLVALGLIFGQKIVSTGSTASDTRIGSSAQNEPARPPRAPVSQIAQATAPEAQAAGTEAIPPISMAQPTPPPAAAAPSRPAAYSSAQGNAQAKPTPTASNIPP